MRKKLLALAVAGVFVLGACGDDDDDDAGSGGDDQTETSADSGDDGGDSTSSSDGDGGGDGEAAGGDYTDAEHDSFIEGCQGGGVYTEEQCECGWDYITQNVSAEEYRDVQSQVASGEITSEDELPDWVAEGNEACGME
jgi:hypothetical protein